MNKETIDLDQDNFCAVQMAEIEADILDTKSALAELSKGDETLF